MRDIWFLVFTGVATLIYLGSLVLIIKGEMKADDKFLHSVKESTYIFK